MRYVERVERVMTSLLCQAANAGERLGDGSIETAYEVAERLCDYADKRTREKWQEHQEREEKRRLAYEQTLVDAREQGRKEGIAAVIAALDISACSDSPESTAISTWYEEWIDSPEGQAAVAAELAKIGGGA